MSHTWNYQIRVYLDDAHADRARRDPGDPALAPLAGVLAAHGATMKSQLDAFLAYVAKAEADGVEKYPLHRWTKATVDDAEKRGKHARSFSIRVGGAEVYDEKVADALEAALQPLVGGGIVRRMSRHDTNPENNLPIPAEFRT